MKTMRKISVVVLVFYYTTGVHFYVPDLKREKALYNLAPKAY